MKFYPLDLLQLKYRFIRKRGTVKLPQLGNDWIRREFRHIEFGDKRLKKRFFKIAELISTKASASIHQSCHGNWNEAKGAYRLLENERVNSEQIISSHREETKKRLHGHSLLFSIQDTSQLDFDSHVKTQGLGSISKAYRKHKMGLMLHSALMVTEQGLPLGLSSVKCWSREPREETKTQKAARIYKSSIREKESFKWIEALQETLDLAPENCQVVTIGDREADIFEFLRAAESLQTGFVVRNRQDRKFITADGKKTKLRAQLSREPIQKKFDIEIPKNRNREARRAQVEVRYTQGFIPIRINAVYGPKDHHKRNRKEKRSIQEKVHIYAIHVREPNPPRGEEPVDWVLLTNLTVEDAESAAEKLKWYGLRWKIEEFFRTLKSGCAIESCRLSTAAKLKKMVMLKSVIAFKLMYLAKSAASHPEEECSKVLSTQEWQTLYRREHRTSRVPKRPPTVLQAIVWLGKLGGFLNRKLDGLPGTMSLWRGYEILQESIRMSLILKHGNYG